MTQEQNDVKFQIIQCGTGEQNSSTGTIIQKNGEKKFINST